MDSSVAAVSTSLEALSRSYRTITNNIANASTMGFKRQVSLVSIDGTTAADTAAGVSETTGLDLTQGALARTGRALDVALKGPGFFVVDTAQGPQYTRHGCFTVNGNRQLVDSAGRTVAGQGGPITLPPDCPVDQIQITADGRLMSGSTSVGQLQVVEFADPKALVPADGTCFTAPAGVAPQPAKTTTAHQGFQESSNVNVVHELVNLITVSRLYEANLKTIQSTDDRSKNLLSAVSR